MTAKYMIFIGEDGPHFFDKNRKPAAAVEPVTGYEPKRLQAKQAGWNVDITSPEWNDALAGFSNDQRREAAVYVMEE